MADSRRLVALFALFLLVAPSRALAQTTEWPRIDFAVGWQYLYDSDLITYTWLNNSQIYAQGWSGAFGLNLTRGISVVGEFSQVFWDEIESNARGNFRFTSRNRIETLMGGVRGNVRRQSRVIPFGQILYGISSFRSSRPVLQFGGGADMMITRPFGLRVAAAYQRLFEPRDHNQFRLTVGVVVALAQ